MFEVKLQLLREGTWKIGLHKWTDCIRQPEGCLCLRRSGPWCKVTVLSRFVGTFKFACELGPYGHIFTVRIERAAKQEGGNCALAKIWLVQECSPLLAIRQRSLLKIDWTYSPQTPLAPSHHVQHPGQWWEDVMDLKDLEGTCCALLSFPDETLDTVMMSASQEWANVGFAAKMLQPYTSHIHTTLSLHSLHFITFNKVWFTLRSTTLDIWTSSWKIWT